MVAKISVFVLHWHSLSKLCQWGAFCRRSILHPWFNQGRWLEWPSMYPKKKKKKSFLHYMHHFVLASHASICSCIACISLFIAYHNNDLEILMVATVCLVFKSNHRIERYCMIKFARSICIVSRKSRPHTINLN